MNTKYNICQWRDEHRALFPPACPIFIGKQDIGISDFYLGFTTTLSNVTPLVSI